MADLIERQAVLAKSFDIGGFSNVVSVYDIATLSAVDAVEVVRCGECIHRGEDSWCAYVDDDPDFFCKRGERRVENVD